MLVSDCESKSDSDIVARNAEGGMWDTWLYAGGRFEPEPAPESIVELEDWDLVLMRLR